MTGTTQAPDLGSPRWQDPSWRPTVAAWVADRLAAAGISRTGENDYLRFRPWAAVFRVPTDAGTLWGKASARGVAHEAGVYEVLGRRSPEHALVPVALDVHRGWLLLPDGGPTMRAVDGAGTDLALWEQLLVEYAALQRSLEPYADELAAAGVPVLTPERLPEVRAGLLADRAGLMVGDDRGLSPEQVDALDAGSATYASTCAELAGTGIAPTLQHDDLHDNNVFAAAERGGPLRVFDWGDSVVAHPFHTLLVTLRVVADRTGLGYGSRGLLRLRDAYLEAWTGEHDRASLVEACRLALRVGGVLRADCYRRALLEATPTARAEWGDGVPAWLLEADQPTPLEPAPGDDQGAVSRT